MQGQGLGGGVPRYIVVAGRLRQAIQVGKYEPGGKIPAETDIAAQYEVSAGTVRQAIRMLCEEGLLDRQQGRGTFVMIPNLDFAARFFPAVARDPNRPPATIRRNAIPAPEHVALALGVTAGDDVLVVNVSYPIADFWLVADQSIFPLPMFSFALHNDASIFATMADVYKAARLTVRADQFAISAAPSPPTNIEPQDFKPGLPIVLAQCNMVDLMGRVIALRRIFGPLGAFRAYLGS